MKNRMFKGSQQQDAQEFLRCLLTQIHDETGLYPPQPDEGDHHHRSCDHRDSMVSCDSDTSGDSHSSQSRLVSSAHSSPLIKTRSSSSSSLSRLKTGSAHNSPSSQSKTTKYSKIISTSSSTKSSMESIPTHLAGGSGGPRGSPEPQEDVVEWAEGDVFEVDLADGKVKVHRNYLNSESATLQHGGDDDEGSTNQITCIDDPLPSESDLSQGSEDRGRVSLPAMPTARGGGASRGDTQPDSLVTRAPPTKVEATPTKVEAPPTGARTKTSESKNTVCMYVCKHVCAYASSL